MQGRAPSAEPPPPSGDSGLVGQCPWTWGGASLRLQGAGQGCTQPGVWPFKSIIEFLGWKRTFHIQRALNPRALFSPAPLLRGQETSTIINR